MSDAVITNIVTGTVTIVTVVVGFLSLWVKLRYGTKKAEEAASKAAIVEGKIDTNTISLQHNTKITENIERNTNGPVTDNLAEVREHTVRIRELETQIDFLGKNLDSTRHEMRGHFQAISNKLDVFGLRPAEKTEEKKKA